jgi:hypothetical protein
MKAAERRFPLSENPGAARYWTGSDGVARPDREYWRLAVFAIVLGVMGADHFYLRSPKTGFLKMLTFGGFGLWWLWDVVQLLTEKERVLNYGMTTPFDIATGIGQGMVTDKSTNYKSNASYGLWTWSTIFGFLGLDSMFVMKNMGQGMRKFFEGIIFIGSLVSIISLGIMGLPSGFFAKIGAIIGGIFAAMGAVIFGTMIGAQWFITIRKALSPPENLFQEGITLTDSEDKQVNSLVSWLMKNMDMTDERKEQVIQDIKYGSMTPERMRAMFQVYHPSEGSPSISPDSGNAKDNPGSLPSFLLYISAPISIWWYWVRLTAKGIIKAIAQSAIPGGAAIEMGMNLAAGVLEQQVKNDDPEARADLLGMLPMPKPLSNAAKLAISGKGFSAIAKGAVKDAVKEVQNFGQSAIEAAAGARTAVAHAQDAVTEAAAGAQDAAAAAERHAKLRAASAARRAAASTVNNTLSAAAGDAPAVNQGGGSLAEPLSLEGKLMGAATIALIGGGAVKFIIDNLMPE